MAKFAIEMTEREISEISVVTVPKDLSDCKIAIA